MRKKCASFITASIGDEHSFILLGGLEWEKLRDNR
jgi:hypothetical protein